LADVSLNDSGSRDAQRITLSIRLSPTSVESKLNEVCSIFGRAHIAAVIKLYREFIVQQQEQKSQQNTGKIMHEYCND